MGNLKKKIKGKMGNEICLTKKERKRRILLARSKNFEQNFLGLSSQFINFENTDQLNQQMKEDHYERRNINKIIPTTLLIKNEELEKKQYKILEDVKKMAEKFQRKK